MYTSPDASQRVFYQYKDNKVYYISLRNSRKRLSIEMSYRPIAYILTGYLR